MSKRHVGGARQRTSPLSRRDSTCTSDTPPKTSPHLTKALQRLTLWFTRNKRSFPWRDSPTPYRVWVSEVMLQQTRSEVVVDYFQAWMQTFPSLEALACASLDEVLKAWEGLGYYSRARRLHQTAKLLVAQGYKDLPNDPKLVATLPGIGPYTLGAIFSFAFQQKVPALDGNVERVLTRLFAIDEEVKKSATQKHLYHHLETLLPEKEPHITQEAFIELGALVCQKQPKCSVCPLNTACLAHQQKTAQNYPVKKRPKAMQKVRKAVFILLYKEQLLVQKGKKGEIMEDLYFFPHLELKEDKNPLEALLSYFHTQNIEVLHQKTLDEKKHAYTNFSATLYPFIFSVEKKVFFPHTLWTNKVALEQKPFCSGHRQLFQEVISCTVST